MARVRGKDIGGKREMGLANYYRVKYPSLEVGWLMRREKWLPMPEVVLCEGLEVGGCYIGPSEDLQLYGGVLIEPSRGTILAADYGEAMPLAGTIAHEFRHHWQKWKGIKFDGAGWANQKGKSYTEAIVEYFLGSVTEMDALLFELKYAHCDESEWRLEQCRVAVNKR